MSLPEYADLSMSVQISRARDLARVAHAGQVDKAGEPYFSHPTAVVRIVQTLPEWHALPEYEKGVALAAGWLHDVVEDTPIDLMTLASLGFPPRVVTVVARLTKRSGQNRETYLREIAADPTALVDKKADLRHNTDPARLAVLDPMVRRRLLHKYAEYWGLLGDPAEARRLRGAEAVSV